MGDIEFLYLNQEDIRATGVNMNTALEAVEDAFRLHHRDQVNLPYKTVLDLGERERGRGNAMPAYVGEEYDVFGIKWIAGFPKNPETSGLPRATGLFVLNDSWNGVPLAVMDCSAPCAQERLPAWGPSILPGPTAKVWPWLEPGCRLAPSSRP